MYQSLSLLFLITALVLVVTVLPHSSKSSSFTGVLAGEGDFKKKIHYVGSNTLSTDLAFDYVHRVVPHSTSPKKAITGNCNPSRTDKTRLSVVDLESSTVSATNDIGLDTGGCVVSLHSNNNYFFVADNVTNKVKAIRHNFASGTDLVGQTDSCLLVVNDGGKGMHMGRGQNKGAYISSDNPLTESTTTNGLGSRFISGCYFKATSTQRYHVYGAQENRVSLFDVVDAPANPIYDLALDTPEKEINTMICDDDEHAVNGGGVNDERHAYALTMTMPAYLVKIRVREGDVGRVNAIESPNGVGFFGSGIIYNTTLYVCTVSAPGKILSFDLSTFTFTNEIVSAAVEEDFFYTMSFYDNYIYAYTFSTPTKIVRFSIIQTETRSLTATPSKSASRTITDSFTGTVSDTRSLTGTKTVSLTRTKSKSNTSIPDTTTTTTTSTTTETSTTTTTTTTLLPNTTSTTAAVNTTTYNSTSDSNTTTDANTTSGAATTTIVSTSTTTTPAPPTTSSTTTTTSTTTSTTTQTSLPPATTQTYAPLPSNLNDTVIQPEMKDVPADSPLKEVEKATSLSTISEIIKQAEEQQKQNQATNAAGETLAPIDKPTTSLFVPYHGLGQFVIKPTAECKDNPNLDFRVDTTGTKVDIVPTAAGSAADVEVAVKSCVAFNPSPEMIARNISTEKFLGVTVAAGSAEATIALALSSVDFNLGPEVNIIAANCTTEVPRGARFTRELGYVFKHSLGLPLIITVTGADLYPLPPSVRITPNASGFIIARGTISDSTPLSVLFTASDGYTQPVPAVCTITPVYIDLRLKNPVTVPYQIHVGDTFTIFVPDDMFESSSQYWIEYIVQESRLPLPAGVSFQRPSTIAGSLSSVGLFRWLVVAADDFNDAQGYILINSTNEAPRPVPPAAATDTNDTAASSSSSTRAVLYDFGRIFAARDMSLEIELAAFFVDPDNDALKYTMNTTQLAQIPWLRSNVAPGGFTRSPQKLTLSGFVPRTARGQNYTLQLTCSDGHNESTIEGSLRVAQGAAPIQIKALPVYTVPPKEVLAEQIQIGEYFFSPDGDQMIVTYRIEPVVTWVTINNNPGVGGAPPTLAITASRDEIEDTQVFIHVTVSNALGDSANATSTINIVRTDWQKIRQVGTILGAAIGVVTSILGTALYYPHIVNAVLGRRLVKKCPLHHTTPRFKFPDRTVRFECRIRSRFVVFGVDLFKGIDFFNHYLYNHFTLKPTPNTRPPVWLNVQDRRMVLVLPPPPEDHIGIKTVICRFWRKQNFLTEEFEASYDECYNGYVFDEAEIKKNNAFTGGKGPEGDDVMNNDTELLPMKRAESSVSMRNVSDLTASGMFAASTTSSAAFSGPDPKLAKKQSAMELEFAETKANTQRKLKKQEQEIREMKQVINQLLGSRTNVSYPASPDSSERSMADLGAATSHSKAAYDVADL